MKIGIIAEGFADIAIIRAVLSKLKGIDGSDIMNIRPENQTDETELNEKNFSNWTLVLKECSNTGSLSDFFDMFEEERYLVIQIDTAERGENGYDVLSPQRSGVSDWKTYSEELRNNVIAKIEVSVEERFRNRIFYAICIEETDAWLIPIWDKHVKDSSQKVRPKETLSGLIARLKDKEKNKLVDTQKKNLNYVELGKVLKKNLVECRKKSSSLDAFCNSVERKLIL